MWIGPSSLSSTCSSGSASTAATVVAAPSISYDLFSVRYVINNLPNEQGFVAKFGQSFPAGFFTPQNLQKMGRN